MKDLKDQAEKLLLDCLGGAEWIDSALYNYAAQLLEMDGSDEEIAELESLAWLISQYASYLDPRNCSPTTAKGKNVSEQQQLEVLTDILKDLDSTLRENFPHVPFDPYLRVKSLFSYFEKIWRNGSTPTEAKSRVKDLLAFRFVLNGTSAEEYVLECFEFHEAIIQFLTACGFHQRKETLKGTDGFDISKFDPEYMYVPDEVIVPNSAALMKAKNYICYPKTNGYQGIQSVLYSPELGIYIEVQVKTLIMLENSDDYESSHEKVYKVDINSQKPKVDDYRIFNRLHGFRSRDGKNYKDSIGLLRPKFYYGY